MRYPTSEKLEIIKLVEQSHLPVRRTLGNSALPGRPFTTGTVSTDLAVPKRWQIAVHGQAGCGTASPIR
jgi:hypothetical protein